MWIWSMALTCSLLTARGRQAHAWAARWHIADSLACIIMDAADRHRIRRGLAFSLVHTESRFDPRATSPTGAIGLLQVLHSTARWIRKGITRAELYEPRLNVEIGFRFLRDMLDRYHGNERLALLAYSQGPKVADQLLGSVPTHWYVVQVLNGAGQ